MESRNGFLKMSRDEFKTYIRETRIARTILCIQQHHTWNPDYSHFNGSNHFERQLAMRNHHVSINGWQDIGQHFTVFPDGTILTGRSLEKTPACIFGNNANSICLEHFGNFDKNEDQMTTDQRLTIIKITAWLCEKFNLPVNPFSIVYHHWFDLGTGERNNGTGNNKSCPGSDFFGGNSVESCLSNFLPLVVQEIGTATQVTPSISSILKYAVVTAPILNIRVSPSSSSAKAPDRKSARLGAILRVYDVAGGWLKISNSQSHWIYGRYTSEVTRATVSVDALRLRSGPGSEYSIVGSLPKSEEVFISQEVNGWCKLAMEDKWLSKQFLDF